MCIKFVVRVGMRIGVDIIRKVVVVLSRTLVTEFKCIKCFAIQVR